MSESERGKKDMELLRCIDCKHLHDITPRGLEMFSDGLCVINHEVMIIHHAVCEHFEKKDIGEDDESKFRRR